MIENENPREWNGDGQSKKQGLDDTQGLEQNHRDMRYDSYHQLVSCLKSLLKISDIKQL